MKSSTKNKSYGDWRSAVDERLQEIYCITIEDAGFDEDYLIRHWQSDEAALEFVAWYGNKYDLDPVTTIYLPREQSR
ncbi:MAG: hypothetical protein K2X57_07365 [Xanthobacteraceae bacterium]|nr:hypothetical protein [Xanthobacteraceae bacterium]